MLSTLIPVTLQTLDRHIPHQCGGVQRKLGPL